MKLKSLHINRGYLANAPLRGEIEFVTEDKTELKIELDEQLSREIVTLCAAAVVRAGQRAADALTTEAMQTTAIEHQPED